MTYTVIKGYKITNSDILARALNEDDRTSIADLPVHDGAKAGYDLYGDLTYAVWTEGGAWAIAYHVVGQGWFPVSEFFDKDIDYVASSPEMAKFEGGGVRSSDEDKPDFSLLFVTDLPYEDQVLTKAAKRMQDGAKLYGRLNHEQMNSREALDRCKASLLRHVVQYLNGETDEEHLAAVVCNAVMVSGIERRLKDGTS